MGSASRLRLRTSRPRLPASRLRMPRVALPRLVPARLLRLPPRTVRLRLTLLYGGLFLVFGVALLAFMYVIFRAATGVDLIVATAYPHGSGGSHGGAVTLSGTLAREVRHAVDLRFSVQRRRYTTDLHDGLLQAGIALATMTAISIGLGWLVAGRVLRPLRVMTATARRISERNLDERLALAGPRDELSDLADTIDGLLARIEAHVAAQRRFAANASHELRTPLSLTQTLLEVAREDPGRDDGELVERLHAVNARAIDLTEALLLLSRADQRSFAAEPVDLSLLAEEAVETLLPLAEKHGVAIQVLAGAAPTAGSPALLSQLVMNLVHNGIVHNLAVGGSVTVSTEVRPSGVALNVENTGEQLSPSLVTTLVEPFQRGTQRVRADQAGVGLGLAIVDSIVRAHEGRLELTPRPGGGLRVSVELPVRPEPRASAP